MYQKGEKAISQDINFDNLTRTLHVNRLSIHHLPEGIDGPYYYLFIGALNDKCVKTKVPPLVLVSKWSHEPMDVMPDASSTMVGSL
mgnify:FL=1